MRMHQIKMLYIFVICLRKIYLFEIKKSFFTKTKAQVASWQPKSDWTIKSGIFCESFGFKG